MNTCKMNSRKSFVSVLMLVCVLLSACAPVATSVAPTSIPATITLVAPALTSAPVATTAPTEIPVPMPAPLTPVVLAEWDVGKWPNIAFGFDSVWILSHRDPNATTRIDPATNKVITIIQDTGYFAKEALVVDDSVWVDGESNDMAKIDPKTNTIVARVAGKHIGLAYGFGSIWSTTRSDELDRIDPVTAERIIVPIELGDGKVDCNNDVVVGSSAVWVDHCDEGELIKIDPATNTVVLRISYDKVVEEAKVQTTMPAGNGTDFLWMYLDKGLVRIDSNTGAGLTFLPHVNAEGHPFASAVTDNAIWVVSDNINHSQLMRLNLTTNQIDATYTIDSGVYNIGIGFGSIWLAFPGGLVQRLDVAP